ncbi:MAG: DUF3426 domain-containing protein [Gammaproteobacteria bacterium]|nr:DUF3426 domain-containing protein [Gammaproteobacteria bacterium]
MSSDPAAGTHTCTCPGCETRFRVTDAQLAVANGRVRCGACLTVFDCSDLIARPEPDEAAAIVPIKAPTASARTRRNRNDPTSVPVGLFVAAYTAAAILLVGLVFGLMFPAWSQQPTVRGVYQATCAILPCELPSLRALDAIAIAPLPAERPGSPPTLSVPVELRNQAPFPQPFPVLAVRMLSADDRELARHRLAPRDYLPRGHSLNMAPDKPVTIELQLEDPGREAARYVLSAL